MARFELATSASSNRPYRHRWQQQLLMMQAGYSALKPYNSLANKLWLSFNVVRFCFVHTIRFRIFGHNSITFFYCGSEVSLVFPHCRIVGYCSWRFNRPFDVTSCSRVAGSGGRRVIGSSGRRVGGHLGRRSCFGLRSRNKCETKSKCS